jgi:hypothetical protein
MRDDKVYVVKGGDSTVLADSLTLPSGAVVKGDATVRFKDGSSTKLKNGQYISIKPAPATTPASTTTSTTTTSTSTTSSDTSATASSAAPVEDRVVMKDDQIYVVKSGDSTLLADTIKLASGAVVSKDGSVKFRNGSTTKLKNGQFIALNPATKEGKKDGTKKRLSGTKKKRSS